jgi:hypothetical protein
MRLRVVAAVREEDSRSASRSSDNSADRRDRFYEWQELGDVVCVRAGEQAGERYAVGVGDQVVLAAEFAPVNRTGAGLVAPKSARSEAESQTTLERSRRPAARSWESRRSCSA